VHEESQGEDGGASEERQSGTDALGSSRPTFVSLLQISVDQVFAPPVTSPFNILLLKEQKRLKARKLVKEMPWSGLSYDRSMLITKSSYSVRVKVALLAEASMTNLAMKLDMITDLLVIIDSVRSNRGFVVFATTHVPSSLDPALRRPGRLDETIALPLLPNLIGRFEVFKLRFGVGSDRETPRSVSDRSFDLFDYSLSTASRNENEIEDWIARSSLLLLSTKTKVGESSTGSNLYPNFVGDYSIYNPSQAFRSLSDSNGLFREAISRSNREKKASNPTKRDGRSGRGFETGLSDFVSASNAALPFLTPAYSKAGEFLVDALLLRNRATYATKFFDRSSAATSFGGAERIEDSLFASLYAARF
jgi:SpoVK/Ycf46/Vps4 family AAA+-type ATPase